MRKYICTFKRGVSLPILTIIVSLSVAQGAIVPSFQTIGDLPGGEFASVACGLSGDGSIVVGRSRSNPSQPAYEPFRWNTTSGIVGLGDLPGGAFRGGALGTSYDGSIVVGGSETDSGREAFRWTAAEGMIALGELPGGEYFSEAIDISADGSTIVGRSEGASGRQAFRWTTSTGMVGLGDLPGGEFSSSAEDVSADGSIIVGASKSSLGTEAFMWTSEAGIVCLGDLPGGPVDSGANAVSADGSTVVGGGNIVRNGTGVTKGEAFVWTVESGMIGLGDLPGGDDFSMAFDVSADGKIVVGDSRSAVGSEAFIWDYDNGMRSLQHVLVNEFGLDLGGLNIFEARGISDDGLTITGTAVNSDGYAEGFIATIPEPSTAILLWVVTFGMICYRRKT